MDKKVIQVGGTVRSGTTMVGLVLANQEKAISLGEVLHLLYPSKKSHFDKIKELQSDPRWQEILNGKPHQLYCNIYKNFPEIDIIVDSSKDPFWFKETLKSISNNIQVQRVVTFKSPDELKKSFEKRNLNNWRKVYLNYYRRFFTLFPHTPSLYFNRFLTDTKYTEKVCEYFDLPYLENILEYWNRVQPNFFGSDTVNQNKINEKAISSKSVIDTQIDQKIKKIFDNLLSRQIGQDNYLENKYQYDLLTINLLYLKDYYLPNKLRKRIAQA